MALKNLWVNYDSLVLWVWWERENAAFWKLRNLLAALPCMGHADLFEDFLLLEEE